MTFLPPYSEASSSPVFSLILQTWFETSFHFFPPIFLQENHGSFAFSIVYSLGDLIHDLSYGDFLHHEQSPNVVLLCMSDLGLLVF